MRPADELLRAELAVEFGFYPASVAPEDIGRIRRQLAEEDRWTARAQNASLTPDQLDLKYAHLRWEKKRAAEIARISAKRAG